ncbi:MAG: antibiotic biosynthesis monooxygenase [Proteobacteria bacterium]|nr:antibiotic biosynthesis monooxygenase [Pseudomonadota bacterium]
MIVEVVHLHAKTDEADALEAGLTAARNVISQSPGYLDSTFHRGIEEPDAFLLTIRWTDVDAHMAGFREGPLFAELAQNVADAPPVRPKPQTQDELLGLFTHSGA